MRQIGPKKELTPDQRLRMLICSNKDLSLNENIPAVGAFRTLLFGGTCRECSTLVHHGSFKNYVT